MMAAVLPEEGQISLWMGIAFVDALPNVKAPSHILLLLLLLIH